MTKQRIEARRIDTSAKSILNLFSTQSVKQKLMEGTLPQWQLFTYFYLVMMFDALGLTQQSLAMIGKQATTVDFVYIWGYFFITAIGLIILYIANGASKGKKFVSKFFGFSFTVGYKYAIALLVLEHFSIFVSPPVKPIYEISLYFIVNLLLVANIAFRMYQTRQ